MEVQIGITSAEMIQVLKMVILFNQTIPLLRIGLKEIITNVLMI